MRALVLRCAAVALIAPGVASRPLCPYPQLARYKGTGEPNDAANLACAGP
jgi:hypothetical protein